MAFQKIVVHKRIFATCSHRELGEVIRADAQKIGVKDDLTNAQCGRRRLDHRAEWRQGCNPGGIGNFAQAIPNSGHILGQRNHGNKNAHIMLAGQFQQCGKLGVKKIGVF